MAIELTLLLNDNVSPTSLARGTEGILRRLTGLERVPSVTTHELVDGRLRDFHSTYLTEGQVLCLGLLGREDRVTVQAHREDGTLHTTIQAGATRDPTEYVLLLAAALHLAVSQEASIEDGFGFWAADGHLVATEFLGGPSSVRKATFEAACQALVSERAPGL